MLRSLPVRAGQVALWAKAIAVAAVLLVRRDT